MTRFTAIALALALCFGLGAYVPGNGGNTGAAEAPAFEPAERTDSAPLQAYVVRVMDRNGDPVPEVFVNFCTDTACTPCESGDDGVITFTGAPAVYHLQVIDVPDGYSFDGEDEMYTEAVYGEWRLRHTED